MTTNPDIAARLLEAYDNMGTATRDDLKEAADTISLLRDRCTVGEAVVVSLVRDLATLSGRSVEEIIAEHRWTT